jgi:hypothetical protein
MSYSTFHEPSACFFHTVRYFPSNDEVSLDASLNVASVVQLVYAKEHN